MDSIKLPFKGTYVIAVSGGVDSVALLDILSRHRKFKLVVAHFDHGMRADSQGDQKFVAGLAERYGLPYETERRELGQAASEATARKFRYDFLFRVRQKHFAKKIITAHHADDVIETMIINLIRGSGWRGLCSLKNTPDICRPLLSVSKADILTYAKARKLSWKKDSTNDDEHYLRNAIRQQLSPLIDRQAWLDLYLAQKKLAETIDQELARLGQLTRYDYIMQPPSVALESIKRQYGLTRLQAKRVLSALKTARGGSSVMAGGQKKLQLTRDSFVVVPLKP